MLAASAQDLRGFPAIGAEEEMNDVVVHFYIALQICIDHLPYRR